MKRKIKVIDNISHKTIEKEETIRNLQHFNTQLNTKAQVYKAKKGKGSYSRKRKHKTSDD